MFEANDYLGGHTATVDITLAEQTYALDTGFVAFNDRTYPNFCALLTRMAIARQPTEMSFSVQHAVTGVEYNGHSLATLFAQRRNLLSPRFYRFIGDILRFNRLAKRQLKHLDDTTTTLGEWLQAHRFNAFFADHYVLPMVSAIWSASLQDAARMPLAFFLRFFHQHGLFEVVNRPQWYVIKGGARNYIPYLTASVHSIRLATPVRSVRRVPNGVVLVANNNIEETFDEVVLACHADQALALLSDATATERDILSRLHYRDNDVVLHTDTRLLPQRRRAWASWNYWVEVQPDVLPTVTYHLNTLQRINAPVDFCVTLNRSAAIDPTKILRRFHYAHPVYTADTLAAQQQRSRICGQHHTHFCGAYWYNGFHEDGVNSAFDVCARFGLHL